jgi:hypothetical protein
LEIQTAQSVHQPSKRTAHLRLAVQLPHAYLYASEYALILLLSKNTVPMKTKWADYPEEGVA